MASSSSQPANPAFSKVHNDESSFFTSEAENNHASSDNDSSRSQNVQAISNSLHGIPRKDLVLIIEQTLQCLGYTASKEALERESGQGRWEDAVLSLQQLDITPAMRRGLIFLLYEQQYLEFISNQAVEEAVSCLANELNDAACYSQETKQRLHLDAGLLMCSSAEDLELRTGWKKDSSRVVLWDRIAGMLPPDIIVPPKRLAVLLRQAMRHQYLHCPYHSNEDVSLQTPISLLQDHSCPRIKMPSRCLNRLDSHTDEVWFVVFSHNCEYIASSSKDKSIILWKIGPNGECIESTRLVGHSEACSYIAWSLDDEYLVSASNDRTARLWKPPHGLKNGDDNVGYCHRIFTKHTESVTAVAWLKDSVHFVTSGFDKCVYLWHIDGTERHRWTFPSRVQDVAISHDGTKMLVVNCDRHVGVIDVNSRKELCALPEGEAVTSICVAKFSDALLVSISQSAPQIRLWDISEKRMIRKYSGHQQGRFVVRCCFGGPDERFVVSGSEDSQIYIWHRYLGSLLEVLSGHASTVNAVGWPCFPASRPGYSLLVSASDDHTVRVWGTESQLQALGAGRGTPCSISQEQIRSTNTSRNPNDCDNCSEEDHTHMNWNADHQLGVGLPTPVEFPLNQRGSHDETPVPLPPIGFLDPNTGRMLDAPGSMFLPWRFDGEGGEFE